MEAIMRVLMALALVNAVTAPTYADFVVDPGGPWSQRINPCAATWNDATSEQRGTMSYNQFIRKCVGGRTALPFKTRAVCEDGTRSAGDSPDGACVYNGGVAEWLN
jgi:hypothetical protein